MEIKTIRQKLEERLQIDGILRTEIDIADIGLTLLVSQVRQAHSTLNGNAPIDSFMLSPVSYHVIRDIEEVVRDHYVSEGYSFIRTDNVWDETVFEKDGRIYSADYNINPDVRVMNFTFGPDNRNPGEYKKQHGLK